MKDHKWRLRSTFQKLTAAFVLVGVLPLILVCAVFLHQYEQNFQASIRSNIEEANDYAQNKVADLIHSLDRLTEMLYDYSADQYSALYDILEDEHLSEHDRAMYVCALLDSMLQRSDVLSAAYFVTPEGTVYHRFYSQQKSLIPDSFPRTALTALDQRELRRMQMLPAAREGDWCHNSTDTVVAIARNYMDTRSPKAVSTTVLGTLYLDLEARFLDELLGSVRLGPAGNAAIVEGASRRILYQLNAQNAIPLPETISPRGGSDEGELYTVFYQPLGESGYQLLLSFDRQELYSSYLSARTWLILMLCLSALLILMLSLGFSGRISKPARQLQKAMEEVRRGNLSTRVDIRSGDEMEYLGEGFNRMTEHLGETIQEVYVAQICQRDAELNALKMQIQPHTLYNTLDIIRMSALECGDEKTARLIESLSHQLRYTMGDHRERVPLRRELDSLQEYAVLVEARYEGRIRLVFEIPDHTLDLLVPKLLLQPFVENAIKHGLRGRPEGGTILIEAERLEDTLRIMVFNDGAPIPPERLAHIRNFLACACVGEQDAEGIVSVGMKTTYDRIKLNCGKQYGFTIDSDESIGVIVTITLSVWSEEGEHVEGAVGG